MTTTATAIIRSALDKLSLRGAGQSVGGNDLAHCLAALNRMCATMNLGPTFAYTQRDTVQAIAAASSVTLGPGMTINIPRPTRIEGSSFTRVGGIDRPLDVVSREEYNGIALKTIGTSWPQVCFFDGGSPTGRLYFWPVAACELHLVTSEAVASFADVTTQYTLPDGYDQLFIYCLAEEVAPDYEVTPRPGVLSMAKRLRRLVKRANVDVPQLDVHGTRSDPQTAFLAGW